MSIIQAQFEKTDFGNIQIAPEVIQVIAGLATVNIEGVAGMSGSLAGGIAELLGRKNLSKGIKVTINESETTIEISIVAKYGHRLHNIGLAIQENVKHAVYSMTEINVVKVNIHVVGIQMPVEEHLEVESDRIR